MTTEDLYLEEEERFGPASSFLYGLGSIFLRRYYRAIVEDLKNRKFDLLLDVGCGNGRLLMKLADNFRNKKFFGLDPSPYMLEMAKRDSSRKDLGSRIEFKIGSSRVIPFDGKFDAIISSFSYHHWKNRDSSLLSLVSHLTGNGFVSIYEYDNSGKRFGTSHGVEEAEWTRLEVEGMSKTIAHKNGLIILTLSKRNLSSV